MWHAEVNVSRVGKYPRWPTLGLKSRAHFNSCAARRKALKTGKGESGAEPAPDPNPNTGSIGILLPSEGGDSAATFQGPHVLATEQRVQPARKAKLMRIPIGDSDIEHQLVAHGSRNSGSCSNNSSIISSSSDRSNEGPRGVDLDYGGQDVSGGSTVSANDSDSSSSSGSNTEIPWQSKKYRLVAVHIGKEVVDVDAMSSDACPVRILSEGDHNVDTSS